MMNTMMSMPSGVPSRVIDNYNPQTTLSNTSMSLPIIKSDLNDSDPKVII